MKWIALVLTLLCACCETVSAHDHNRPELNEWFNKLASSKGLCCSFVDGEIVVDADWETKNGRFRVRLDNEWIDVPDEAVIKEPNLDGQTIVWPARGYLGTSIRCFMPGTMG